MTDHRVDIKAYATIAGRSMNALITGTQNIWEGAEFQPGDLDALRDLGLTEPETLGDLGDWQDEMHTLVDGWLLEVEHTATVTSDGDAAAPVDTTLTLRTGGGPTPGPLWAGPTVRVIYSHRSNSAKLFHSWGRSPHPSPPGSTVYADRDTWKLDAETVRVFIDRFCPHPAGGRMRTTRVVQCHS